MHKASYQNKRLMLQIVSERPIWMVLVIFNHIFNTVQVLVVTLRKGFYISPCKSQMNG